MDVSEIMRLAGADEDAETFQVALEGKPRPGSQLALRPAAPTGRRALAEKRGYAAPMPYNPHADRVYSRMCVAVDALGEVNGVVGDLWKCLDRMRFGEDPDSGFGEVAAKIQEGPLADIEKLVKGVGFALDQGFDRRGEHESVGPFGGMVKMIGGGGMGVYGLDTCCLHMRGEVAEALAILKIVAPEIDKASPRDLPEIDADLWKKAGPAFLKSIEGRVDVLCAAVEKLIERKMGSKSGTMADALDRQQLAQGAALAEALGTLPPERPDWGTGLSEAASDKGALRLMLLLTPNYDKNEVYAFVKVLNAKLAKDKKLSAGMTSKYDATQVTDIDFHKGSAELWFAMAPEAEADKAHAKLLSDLVADAVLGYENADILFHWDGDEERPAKGTYAARELEIAVVESALRGIAEAAADMVGKAFVQRLGNDEFWVLGTQALKNGSLKVSVVKAYADQGGKPEKAKQGSFTMSDLTRYKQVPLKDVPVPVAVQWKASGALKEASESLAATQAEAGGPSQSWRLGVVFHAPGGQFNEPMWILPFETTKNGAATKVHLVKWPSGKKKPLPAKQAGGWDERAFSSNGAKAVEVKDIPAEVLALLKATGALKGEHAPAMEAMKAVFVARFSIPAHKPSAADESWAAEEAKMASDFELAMERSPIKSAKAPKAQIKVTKIGFEGTGAKYALKVTVEVSGEGVSSEDDDLITALDKRGDAALDAVVQHGEQAAEVAFGDTDWKRSTLEVM